MQLAHFQRGFWRGLLMFSKDPYFDAHVFPAVTAFREAKAELISLEQKFEADRSEDIVNKVRSAQERFEATRIALRNATRVAPPVWAS